MSLRAWWLNRADLFMRLLTLFASYASLVALLFVFIPANATWPWWARVLLAVAVVTLLLWVWLEVAHSRGRRVYARRDVRGIRTYMHDWIAHGGRVAIWSRDMSWAQNADTHRLLTEKALRRELVLCLPEVSDLADELRGLGAEVCVYGSKLLESPASRFTITLLGRAGSRVAVGRGDGELHVIDEFCSGDHPAFYLAADLVALVRALHREQGEPT